jgi:hypothetical protein
LTGLSPIRPYVVWLSCGVRVGEELFEADAEALVDDCSSAGASPEQEMMTAAQAAAKTSDRDM